MFKIAFMSLFFASLPSWADQLGVLERYTTLRTIAGLGNLEDSNFWQSSFEGSNPRLVELSNPHHCGTDAWGRVYIVDKESHSVLRVSADGSILTTVAGTHTAGNGNDLSMPATSVPLSNPNGLFVFADGSFLILDTDNNKVRKVSAEGIIETLFTYSPGFGAGRGLIASSDGQTVYFCGEFSTATSQLVKQWTSEDGFSTIATIPTTIRGLGNLDLAPDGALFVTSVGGHRVYRVPQNGTPEIVAGNGITDGSLTSGALATSVSLDRVRGIAILPDGTFFLATQKGGDVWWVDNGPNEDGLGRRIHLFVNGAGSGNIKNGDGENRLGATDRIAEPRAIHLATNGDLLITCNDTGVIRAVRNVCKPVAPELHIQGLQLTWEATWRDAFSLESSQDLSAASWTSSKGLSASSTGTQSLELTNQNREFLRLVAPQLAGGQ